MKVTLLGTGASAGVPMIGGADGGGRLGRLRSRTNRATAARDHQS